MPQSFHFSGQVELSNGVKALLDSSCGWFRQLLTLTLNGSLCDAVEQQPDARLDGGVVGWLLVQVDDGDVGANAGLLKGGVEQRSPVQPVGLSYAPPQQHAPHGVPNLFLGNGVFCAKKSIWV